MKQDYLCVKVSNAENLFLIIRAFRVSIKFVSEVISYLVWAHDPCQFLPGDRVYLLKPKRSRVFALGGTTMGACAEYFPPVVNGLAL